MPRFHICTPLTLIFLLTATTVLAEEAVYPVPFQSPVHSSQTYEQALPSDVKTIHKIEVVFAGEFDGTIWLCNLETPNAFDGPGGLRFQLDAVPPTEPPAMAVATWSAPTGPYDLRYTLLPPGGDWNFLVEAGRLEFTVDEYIPESWDCYLLCHHGCMDVSGFDGLTTLQLVIDYDKMVPAFEPSWGMLKARW